MSRTTRLDEAERALYRAARSESPSPAARARALDALRHADRFSEATWADAGEESTSPSAPLAPRHARPARRFVVRRSTHAVAMVAGALAAALAVWLHRPRENTTSDIVKDEPAPARSEHRSPPSPPSPPPASAAASSTTTAEPSEEPRRRTPPPRSRPAPEPTLADETGALDRARGALGDGQPRRALTELDDYERVLRGHRLTDEATLLRIEALERSGKADAASDLATRFAARHPDSPLVDRALSLARPAGAPKRSEPRDPSPAPSTSAKGEAP